MTQARRRWWILPLVVVAALTGVASMIVAAAVLLVPPDEPEPRPPVVQRTHEVPPAAPVSDVRWDAAAERREEELPAVPVKPGDEFHVVSELGDEAVAAAVLAASRKALPLTLELLGGD